MKTTIIIIAAIFSLQAGNIFGANDLNNNEPMKDFSATTGFTLAPVTPAEADFSDFISEPVMTSSFLAPVSPASADFGDNAPEMVTASINLAPNAPLTADFEENTPDQDGSVSLAPTTPMAAEFE
jgi:hypothetical protein